MMRTLLGHELSFVDDRKISIVYHDIYDSLSCVVKKMYG